MDIYRPMSFQDFDDLNPIRRDGFLDNSGTGNYNNSFRLKDPKIDPAKAKYNPNDPDNDDWEEVNPQGFTSLISDKVRVYKGGSWKDVAYWMSPGTRRYLDQDSSTATIGFRCAMIRAGSNY
jgi:hypothetical protein